MLSALFNSLNYANNEKTKCFRRSQYLKGFRIKKKRMTFRKVCVAVNSKNEPDITLVVH